MGGSPVSRTASFLVRWLLLFCLVAALVVGCGRSLPKTHTVRGKVLAPSGQPLTGGAVHLQSDRYRALTISGVIQADGTFSLTTVKDKAQSKGAPAGTYTVLVSPPSVGHVGAATIALPDLYNVHPGENTLDIDLGKVVPEEAPR
jgi:hypothetical protein